MTCWWGEEGPPRSSAARGLTLWMSSASVAASFFSMMEALYGFVSQPPEAQTWQARKHTHSHTVGFFPSALAVCLWAVRSDRRGHSTAPWLKHKNSAFPFLLWQSHAEIFFQIKHKPIQAHWLNSSLWSPVHMDPCCSQQSLTQRAAFWIRTLLSVIALKKPWSIDHCCWQIFRQFLNELNSLF